MSDREKSQAAGVIFMDKSFTKLLCDNVDDGVDVQSAFNGEFRKV